MKFSGIFQQLIVLALAALAAGSIKLYLQVQQHEWRLNYYHGPVEIVPPAKH